LIENNGDFENNWVMKTSGRETLENNSSKKTYYKIYSIFEKVCL
jgi:hypothetical protein